MRTNVVSISDLISYALREGAPFIQRQLIIGGQNGEF